MSFTVLNSASRLLIETPAFSRSIVNRSALRPVPRPQGSIATPTDFLKAIGRSADTKLKSEQQWEEFWSLSGHSLRQLGIAVRDRRYILWCMEKYRSGHSIQSFAHEPEPKKTVRGWGPSVQNGKRIRSCRIKDRKIRSRLEAELKEQKRSHRRQGQEL